MTEPHSHSGTHSKSRADIHWNVTANWSDVLLTGSDFIKTSTGKESVNATYPVAIVMARAIRDYFLRTGHKVRLWSFSTSVLLSVTCVIWIRELKWPYYIIIVIYFVDVQPMFIFIYLIHVNWCIRPECAWGLLTKCRNAQLTVNERELWAWEYVIFIDLWIL